MKTEPIEAYFKEPENTFREWIKSVKTIKENLLFIADNGRINGSLLLDVLKLMQRSFEEGQSSPKIKQLEWVESDGEYWEAITRIGTYSITFDSGSYVTLYDLDNDIDGEWRSLAKAKAAAQADFEKRIKECLV